MSLWEWGLELVLLAALGATGFYAVRLERALRVLRGDRDAVGELVAGFDRSARTAGQGLDRLREAADSAGREIARHVERAATLKDDLFYLTERGERLADRMDMLVRAGRPADAPVVPAFPVSEPVAVSVVPRREPAVAQPARSVAVQPVPARPDPGRARVPEPAGPLRSQAERDLLKALGVVR